MLNMPNPIPIDPAWLPAGVADKIENNQLDPVKWSRGEKKMLRRKKKVRPSEFVKKHIITPDDSPAGKGPWRDDMTPFWVGVMDASFFPSVQEIIICAAPQTGKSQCSANCIGYAIDRAPGNVLLVMPNEKDGGDYMRDRFHAMLLDSKKLRAYTTGYDDDISTLRVKLRHMKIYAAWANSASRLAWRALPYGVADEEDKYPETVNKKEGSPVDQIRQRQRNFSHMRKLWRLSSPTMENTGIWKGLTTEAEVRFEYWVRCPVCHESQVMTFDRIKWEGRGDADPKKIRKNKSAWYECEKCKAKWDDTARNLAVKTNDWRDKETGISLFTYLESMKPIVIGFHVPAWLSPMVSLSECAAAFIEGLQDKNKLKNFYNNYAAEPWKIYKKEREASKILALCDDRPRGRVPGGNVVAGITAAVDTQDHGFWYEIRAWGWGGPELLKASWGIKDGFCPYWGELERVLWGEDLLDADGNRYVISLVIQDALGHRTAEVYNFCVKHRGKVFPSFGRDVMAQPYTWSNQEYYPGTKKPIPGGLKSINVNTKYYKDELSRLLEIDKADPSAWLYHSEFSEAHARHMTAEFINDKGLWECPSGKDNHLWDCAVLNLVAADILGIKFWPKPEDTPAVEPEVAQQEVAKSKFMSRG